MRLGVALGELAFRSLQLGLRRGGLLRRFRLLLPRGLGLVRRFSLLLPLRLARRLGLLLPGRFRLLLRGLGLLLRGLGLLLGSLGLLLRGLRGGFRLLRLALRGLGLAPQLGGGRFLFLAMALRVDDRRGLLLVEGGSLRGVRLQLLPRRFEFRLTRQKLGWPL